MSTRRAARACLSVVLAAGIAGTACSGPSAPSGQPGAGPGAVSATRQHLPVPSRPDGAGTAEVEQAYRRFWRVAQKVDREPVQRWRGILETVAGDPLLKQLLDGLLQQRDRGIVQYGEVVPRPTVALLDGERASVVDCQDASRSGEVDRSTGEVERIGSARTPVAAVLQRDPRGRWKVTEARYLSEPC